MRGGQPVTSKQLMDGDVGCGGSRLKKSALRGEGGKGFFFQFLKCKKRCTSQTRILLCSIMDEIVYVRIILNPKKGGQSSPDPILKLSALVGARWAASHEQTVDGWRGGLRWF